jgi:soluble lytic murein transglycosylase-like protein
MIMPAYHKLKLWFAILIFGVLGIFIYTLEERVDRLEDKLSIAEGTTSLMMYQTIEKYADSFNVPKHVAFNVAYLETHYRGPFDWDYNPERTSSAGAVGPMQIIPRYAHHFAGRRVGTKELKENIELNVLISMKMLRKWYSMYHDWTLACGAYNTGQPVRNSYAQYATSNRDYKDKWIKI